MSRERELLKECYFFIDNKIDVSPKALLIRMQELFAQPEQEPVGFIKYGRSICWTTHARCLKTGDLLYTAPPKREPIDTRRITLKMFSEGVDMQYKNGYVDGIKYAEKAHGIGGGE